VELKNHSSQEKKKIKSISSVLKIIFQRHVSYARSIIPLETCEMFAASGSLPTLLPNGSYHVDRKEACL